MESVMQWIVGGGLVGLMALVLKNNKDYENRLSRTWERLDEVKHDAGETYVRKDMCELQHRQVNENFERVKADLVEIKLDLKQILKNGIK